ncbi:hypothetical protein OEZ60_00560 [Defluviimonas sp. WL0024]|uniref:Immunity MXAN-0049 protein domain-containing protein n=1 Tax=Albidovulum salinarum TaxID=2984153 RepID=A0ABT2WXU5_9RHOB|nr:DUF1629 domain-containing protein [Defluviimonas sp. WL0024]MCU9846495.1 hypothetical protein [Defluviimonas sp. WL0024]
MTEEERARIFPQHAGAYISTVSRKFRHEIGTTFDHRVIEPLAPHEFPTELRLERTYGGLGDWLLLDYGVMAVEEGLKALIEELDPGAHRFWPLRITTRKGQDVPGRYHGMVIDRFLEAFRPEETSTKAFEGEDYYSIRGVWSKAKYTSLVMSKAAIGDAHVWRERKLTDPNIFISDALMAAIDAAGMKILPHYQTKTV